MNNKKLRDSKVAKDIFVTQPALPDLKELMPFLEDIWDSRWLTNNGKYHQEFEKKLTEFLGVNSVSLFANGTLALITALQALNIRGEVITTPYSFVATTHALHWNGIKPVFCDIDAKTLNIDPEKIEDLITPETSAIMPVHVYGNPCDHEKIIKICEKHNLKLIYDAAQAFNVQKDNESILNWGDLSIVSFHATKVFTTFEGGAIISKNYELKKQIDFLKNFGFANETTVVGPGINGKMNELQAAIGLLQLSKVDKYIAERKKITIFYREKLKSIQGIYFQEDMKSINHNYSYFPVFVNEKEYGLSRDELYQKFKEKKIHVRRYFYPLISQFPTYKRLPSAKPMSLSIAEKQSKNVICLPLYSGLSKNNIDDVIDVINRYK